MLNRQQWRLDSIAVSVLLVILVEFDKYDQNQIQIAISHLDYILFVIHTKAQRIYLL